MMFPLMFPMIFSMVIQRFDGIIPNLHTSSGGVESDAGSDGVFDSWNGELDSLRSSEWYGTIPEEKRELLEAGLNAKYKAWSSGYGKKFESLANERKAFEEEMSRREARAARDLEMAQKLWYGDSEVDPRISELETTNKQLTAELEELRGVSRQLRGDAFEAQVKATYGDIYHHDDAILKWADLVEGGSRKHLRATARLFGLALVQDRDDIGDGLAWVVLRVETE